MLTREQETIMCVSAEVSFAMAGLLGVGGVFATKKAFTIDTRYVPLALFPILVAIQQFFEGLVWVGLETNTAQLIKAATLTYLFFTWMVWPSWVPFMTARLELAAKKKRGFMYFSKAGIVLGAILYLPNFWNADWVNPQIFNHSIAYNCALITESLLPHEFMYTAYLAIIALPPLLSSHHALKIFGVALTIFIPIAYFFFYSTGLSVLCFFAAIVTFYIIWLILKDHCPSKTEKTVSHV